MLDDATLTAIADELLEAQRSGVPIPLITARHPGMTVEDSYAIQRIWADRKRAGGSRLVGRKIGLTARSVQQQLGVDSPDFGNLWAGSSFGDGDEVPLAGLIQPRVEAEVALVLGRDVTQVDATVADVMRATDFALAALEIVDSRIADWKIGLFDTIADNASENDPNRSAGFLASMRRMARSTGSGTSGAKSRSGGTGSVAWPFMISKAPPVNGARPANI